MTRGLGLGLGSGVELGLGIGVELGRVPAVDVALASLTGPDRAGALPLQAMTVVTSSIANVSAAGVRSLPIK